MDSKMKKQKRKLISRIGIILFCVWLVLSAVYSVAVLNIKEEEFISNANKDYSNLYQNLFDIHSYDYNYTLFKYIDSARQYTFTDDLNVRSGKNKSYENDYYLFDSNKHITATLQTTSGNTYFDTNSAICLTFSYLYGETRNWENGILYYNDFISSMTSEQCESIKAYLAVKPDKKGNYYELLCTEYYYNEDEMVFIPKTVEIVLSNQLHTWYAEDTVIETYQLNPKNTQGCILRKHAKDARTVIPDQFVTGEFICRQETDSIEGTTDYLPATAPIMIDMEVTFPLQYTCTGVAEVRAYLLKMDENSQETNEYEYEEAAVKFHYTIKENLLKTSAPSLLAGYGIIFLFLLIIGIILVLSLWTIIKTQASEEQKRREVTNSLAHDIKTPLFIIEGYAQSLKENLHTEKREHYADRIMERTKECNRLVHQMLSFSSLDSQDFILSTEDLDVEKLLKEVITDFSQLSDISRISVSIKEACTVNADRELLKRVLTNLTDNALKYSDEGTEINITLTESHLSFSNICSAITDEDIKHITEPFYRAEKNRVTEGSGLGLAMVDSVAKHHGFALSATLSEGIVTLTLTFKK